MADLNERLGDETDTRPQSEGESKREPDLADLISAWYGAARAQLLARRRSTLGPSAATAATHGVWTDAGVEG
jgi:hypothetical protein